MPEIILIAAMTPHRVIGADGRMPWHVPGDLEHFQRTTMGHPVVMGRRTWESFGGAPLPGRTNIVLSSDPAFEAPGATVCRSLDDALRVAGEDGPVYICGGAGVYAEALPLADVLLLSEMHVDPPGDTYFPQWDTTLWREVSRERREGFDLSRWERGRPGLREAGLLDAGHVGRLQARVFSDAYGDALTPGAIDEQDFTATWQRALAAPPERALLLVATEANTVVGYLALGPSEDPDAEPGEAEILTLGVAPEHRRHGHGSRLLNEAGKRALALGFRRIQAWCPEEDAATLRFLQWAGMEADGARRSTDLGAGIVTDVRLAADLGGQS